MATNFEEVFIEAKEYALSCGYSLTKLSNDNFCKFSLCSNGGRIGQFTKLTDILDVINEGRLLSGEACAWPMPINSLNNSQGAIVANLKIKNKEEIDKSRKINLKINGKMVAVNPDDHNLKLTHDPVFGWQLVGADSQELIREPLNPQTKEQPSLKFKTKESAINFAAKLMAKIKKI